MFGISFLRRPAPVRYVVATRRESRSVTQKAADKRLELETMRVHMTADQLDAAKALGSVRDEEALARVRHNLRRRAKRNRRAGGEV